MVRRRELQGPPVSAVQGNWPHGATEDPAVSAAQRFARNLDAALADCCSLREVGRRAGLAHTTLAALRRGERWPDVVSIVRLEDALDVDLWPPRIQRRAR